MILLLDPFLIVSFNLCFIFTDQGRDLVADLAAQDPGNLLFCPLWYNNNNNNNNVIYIAPFTMCSRCLEESRKKEI